MDDPAKTPPPSNSNTDKTPPPRLVLVRHAKPIIESHLPPSQWRLSLSGHESARRLGAKLKNLGFAFHHIASSPEAKALETARGISAGYGGGDDVAIAVNQDADLAEHKRDESDFLPRAEFEEAMARLLSGGFNRLMFGRETADAAFARVDSVIRREQAAVSCGSDVLIVTHGTVLSLYLNQRHMGIGNAFEFWQRLTMPTAVIVDEGGGIAVLQLEDAASRWDDGHARDGE